MAAPQWHSQRIAARIQREVSWLLVNRVNDPRIPSMVTPVEVRLSPDGRQAVIFVSVIGNDAEKAKIMAALNHAAPFLQSSAAQTIRMKHFPKFLFKLDVSMDYSLHINELLKGVQDDVQRPEESDSE